jgi:hypothetical protein
MWWCCANQRNWQELCSFRGKLLPGREASLQATHHHHLLRWRLETFSALFVLATCAI